MLGLVEERGAADSMTGYVCTSVNQDCAIVTLNEVERLVIDAVSVPYPSMLVSTTARK